MISRHLGYDKLSHVANTGFSGTKLPLDAVKRELFVGWHEARLAKAVGLDQFGVNLVELEPGSASALRHWHEAEDEFIYVLEGELTLIDENGEHMLTPGSFAGFPAGVANAHHILNRSPHPAKMIVVGSRRPGQERIHYPDDPIGPIVK